MLFDLDVSVVDEGENAVNEEDVLLKSSTTTSCRDERRSQPRRVFVRAIGSCVLGTKLSSETPLMGDDFRGSSSAGEDGELWPTSSSPIRSPEPDSLNGDDNGVISGGE